jgi:hypothetical protein
MSSKDIDPAICDIAEAIFLNNAILNHFHLLLLVITLSAIFILIYRYWQHPITVHGNLLVKIAIFTLLILPYFFLIRFFLPTSLPSLLSIIWPISLNMHAIQ